MKGLFRYKGLPKIWQVYTDLSPPWANVRRSTAALHLEQRGATLGLMVEPCIFLGCLSLGFFVWEYLSNPWGQKTKNLSENQENTLSPIIMGVEHEGLEDDWL